MAALQHEDLFNLSIKKLKEPPITKIAHDQAIKKAYVILSRVQAGDKHSRDKILQCLGSLLLRGAHDNLMKVDRPTGLSPRIEPQLGRCSLFPTRSCTDRETTWHDVCETISHEAEVQLHER